MIFVHQPADAFDNVDPSYELRTNDYRMTNVAIQDGRSYGGGFAINEYGENFEWCRIFAIERSLTKAKARALALYAERGKVVRS